MSDRDISHLCPALQSIYYEWQAQCLNAGLYTKAIVTWRSAEDQNAAKESGLSNAGAGQSPHDMVDSNGNPASCAFDYGIFEKTGDYVTDGTDERYTQAGSIGKTLNLTWGGDFKSFPDYDHLELTNWKDYL